MYFAPHSGIGSPSRRSYTLHMKLLALVWPVLLAATSTCAMAQWQWVDKDGRRVFSDRPPPTDIADKNIISRPKGYSTLADTKPSSTASAPQDQANSNTDAKVKADLAPSGKPADKGKDKELEAKKAAAEKAEANKKREQEAKNQAIKEDNCSRARKAQAMFANGYPIRMPNDQGQMVPMTDAQRAEESQRANEAIATNCN